MESLVIIVHVLVALAIIGLILLQQGKGAEAGASFGSGASQTVFGSQGGGSFFAKVTAILAVIFFATSFSLTIVAKNKAAVPVSETGVPAVVEQAVSEPDVPVIEQQDTVSDVPVVVPSTEQSATVDAAKDAPVDVK